MKLQSTERELLARFALLACFTVGIVFSSEAQLLEDTDSKLKNAKIERRGFLFFRGKSKDRSKGISSGSKRTGAVRYSSAGSPFKANQRVSPKYSSPRERAKRYSLNVKYSPSNPFRGTRYQSQPRYSGAKPFGRGGRTFSPRYSPSNPLSGRQYKVVTRNSPSNPFRGTSYKREIRYSPSNPFKGDKYKISPRYSPGNPFKGTAYKVSPRYSPSNPFKGQSYKLQPRYSPGNPFRGNDYKVQPRYSLGNPFRGSDYKVAPRYSEGSPFRAQDYKIEPRYSQGMPFRGVDYKVKPRYSEEMPFRGKEYTIRPKYTGRKYGPLQIMRYKELRLISYYHESSMWKGDWKIKVNRPGDQHPSSNYHFAMKFSDPTVRKLLRKWNIYWTRLNGASQKPKGVKKSPDKPKFDKDERVIWN
ncbi:MAG: hypothetical protein AAF616_14615 [Bacteroidota bacterium]